MSLMELFDVLEYKKQLEHQKQKEHVKTLWIMVCSLSEQIAATMSSEIVPRQLWDIFPGQFEEERTYAEEQRLEQDAEKAKANRRARAEAMKQRQLMKEMEGGE